MGKNSLVAFFLVTVAAAVYLFLGRESSAPLYEFEPGQKRLPRIQLEEFTIYKYEGHKILSTASGKMASFLDPNTLDLMGNIQGQNLESPRREFFTGESARVTFAARGLAELMKNSRIQRTEIENRARFGFDGNVLLTDYAKFLHEEERIVSDRPVRVKGPRIEMEGSKGFNYETDTGDLKVYGPLEGMLIGTDKD